MNGRFAWLQMPDLAALLATLDRDGEEARVIGGAVRNALLGEPVTDWDIATTALPQEVMTRCASAGWKAVPTGIDHGTVTIVIQGRPFEVTTLREDVETDGRHAVVRFGRDFAADARRRDFTINALSVSRDGTLHDPVGGENDLEHRRIRFIGDPATRIAEDYLRILRFFRFHARYGNGQPDAAGLAAAIAARNGLALLSRERIQMEILKTLVARDSAGVFDIMAGGGILLRLLGRVTVPPRLRNMAALEARLGLAPDPLRRLAALAVGVREDATALVQRLRLSNTQGARLHAIAEFLERNHVPPSRIRLCEELYRHGRDVIRDALLVAAASNSAVDWAGSIGAIETIDITPLPWRGADLQALGVPPGPRIGQLLAELERRWIAAGLPNDSGERAAILDASLMALGGTISPDPR